MIRIPNSLFVPKIHNGRVGRVFVYALNAFTIGISPELCPDWDKEALWKKTWQAWRRGSNWIINLPSRVTRFYLLRESGTKMVTTASSGSLLVTVTREYE